MVCFLLGAISAPICADVISSPYLNQTALIFKAEDLRSQRLPSRIHKHNVPMIFSSQITLACLGAIVRTGELVAYLPESKSCIPLTRLSASRNPGLGRDIFKGLERDRAKLERSLEKDTVVVMQAQVRAEGAAGICTCPPLNEQIFRDGFEDLLR
jgi:hypothetical protein